MNEEKVTNENNETKVSSFTLLVVLYVAIFFIYKNYIKQYTNK